MVSTKQLSKLKKLQRIRRERDRHILGLAVSETRIATSEEDHARHQLKKSLDELNRKAREATLDFDRFRVLASQVSDFDTRTHTASARREACASREAEARQQWSRSEQQAKMLSKQIASHTRREARRADEKTAREHLSRSAQNKRSAP